MMINLFIANASWLHSLQLKLHGDDESRNNICHAEIVVCFLVVAIDITPSHVSAKKGSLKNFKSWNSTKQLPTPVSEIEIRTRGGLESGDDFRKTDNLQRLSNIRHL